MQDLCHALRGRRNGLQIALKSTFGLAGALLCLRQIEHHSVSTRRRPFFLQGLLECLDGFGETVVLGKPLTQIKVEFPELPETLGIVRE